MKRILAISLLFIFLSGQVNLTWGTHFCGPFSVESSVSFGKDHLSCGMEEDTCCNQNAGVHSGPIFSSERCCSNDYFSSDADDFFFKTETEKKRQMQFVSTNIPSFQKLFQTYEHKYPQTKSLSYLIPPDRQVLYQTFLL